MSENKELNYKKTNDLNEKECKIHFTRVFIRDIIAEEGLVPVAGGENEAGNDKEHPTIYFANGIEAMYKTVDSFLRWEYHNYVTEQNKTLPPREMYKPCYREQDPDAVRAVMDKVYNDFKTRIYFDLDLVEGDDPKTSDYQKDANDVKKEEEKAKYEEKLEKYNQLVKEGKIPKDQLESAKPKFPNPYMGWMYGNYSDFSSCKQDDWNMNTHIDGRGIEPERITIIETENGRSDALSVLLELYEKNKDKFKENKDLEVLNHFITYAKERYIWDKDYIKNAPDLGRRYVTDEERENARKRCLGQDSKEMTEGLDIENQNPYEVERETENLERDIAQYKNKEKSEPVKEQAQVI